MKIDQKHSNVRTTIITIAGDKVSEIIARGASAEMDRSVRPNIDRANVKYRVSYEDETAGSPPYKVGTRAIVTITEDLNDTEAPEVEHG